MRGAVAELFSLTGFICHYYFSRVRRLGFATHLSVQFTTKPVSRQMIAFTRKPQQGAKVNADDDYIRQPMTFAYFLRAT